jgi:hypothetical protein
MCLGMVLYLIGLGLYDEQDITLRCVCMHAAHACCREQTHNTCTSARIAKTPARPTDPLPVLHARGTMPARRRHATRSPCMHAHQSAARRLPPPPPQPLAPCYTHTTARTPVQLT